MASNTVAIVMCIAGTLSVRCGCWSNRFVPVSTAHSPRLARCSIAEETFVALTGVGRAFVVCARRIRVAAMFIIAIQAFVNILTLVFWIVNFYVCYFFEPSVTRTAEANEEENAEEKTKKKRRRRKEEEEDIQKKKRQKKKQGNKVSHKSLILWFSRFHIYYIGALLSFL